MNRFDDSMSIDMKRFCKVIRGKNGNIIMYIVRMNKIEINLELSVLGWGILKVWRKYGNVFVPYIFRRNNENINRFVRGKKSW